MASVICTLFENHYHYGLAVLVNSLHKQGYKGDIYVGYKGTLPAWVTSSSGTENRGQFYEWPSACLFKATAGIQLVFLPLDTDYHLTNYKPDFMLQLLAGPANGADKIFYFDPDIIITAPWQFIKNWPDCGVAVCEDVNSPFPQYHPHRVHWRNIFKNAGIELTFKDAFYANGGYIGLKREDYAFLELWKKVQEAMGPHIGGLSRSIFKSAAVLTGLEKGPFAPFGRTDQDALNAAMEAWNKPVSMIGKEAMAFKHGGASLPHALGSPKPWEKKYLNRAFKGRSPGTIDKLFWSNLSGAVPIKASDAGVVKRKLAAIAVAKFIGRFYKS
ncbi:hypothetical protein [Mucilaginibacter lacusdianchii]|uniref:hypothetical protein n=1 Tax=Mucilaginibacter lacusdianchii TaxID=2684211 RepID=UPI00131DEEA9|nr:hypothetical protein [Mucilaginibacter sp. JXJ CY 39]